MITCPDCNGTKVYKSWPCQLCGGEGEVEDEAAQEHIEDWAGYKEMMRGYAEVED